MDPQEDSMQLPVVQNNSPLSTPLPSVQPAASGGDPVIPDFSQASVNDPTIPTSAEDIDLIEKAWVEKAKNIVKNTMGNPHAQSEEINKMKADYIKKRYNKEIKASK